MLDDVVAVLKEQLDDVAESRNITILNEERALGYVHILFRGISTTNFLKAVNAFKGATSRKLRDKFLKLKEHKSLISSTYFLATTGEVTLE